MEGGERAQTAKAVAPSRRPMAAIQLTAAPEEAPFEWDPLPLPLLPLVPLGWAAVPVPVAVAGALVVTFVGYALPAALTSKGCDVA